MLILVKTDLAIKEKNGKKYLVSTNGTGSGKIILALLTKVVAFHMGFTMIEVWELGFEWTFLKA